MVKKSIKQPRREYCVPDITVHAISVERLLDDGSQIDPEGTNDPIKQDDGPFGAKSMDYLVDFDFISPEEEVEDPFLSTKFKTGLEY